DLEHAKMWVIPAEKSKNGLAHRVPLSPLAIEILGAIKQLSGDSVWLFPSPAGDRAMTGQAVNHAVLRVVDKLEIGEMRPHDLRRTAASHMASMGISRFNI